MRKFVLAAAVLTASLALLPGGRADDGDWQVVSVPKRAFLTAGLGRLGLDLLMERDGRVFILATPGEMAALGARRIEYVIEPPGAFAARAPALAADGGINGAFHSVFELATDLRTLERDHPGLAEVRELGESLEGRPILALKISDNAAIDEGEPAVLFLGCHHAREWISVEVPFLLGRSLLESYAGDPEVKALVDASEIWIVPIVNPDGLEYSIHVYRYWRKNRRANAGGTYGVDLNRNYGYAWGFDDEGSSGYPGSEVYRGTAPFSEPETAAVRALWNSRDFRAMISFHSYSQKIMYPWGYTQDPAPDRAALDELAGAMAGLIAGSGGTVYGRGQASRLLYATNGDTTDWTYSLRGAPSFTIELPPVDVDHGGFFNDEAAIGAVFGENLPAMLYLARYGIDHPLPTARPRPYLRERGTAARGPGQARRVVRPGPDR